jgi:hypothetical protein
MKAIETIYNNYRFRSRLEARHAVFFDALSIKYEYELEGFDLEGKWYLPDFWLPQQGCWFEVKGQFPLTQEEYEKCHLLCKHSQKQVYVAAGAIQIAVECDMQEAIDGRWTQLFGYNPAYRADSIYPDSPLNTWCECPRCHKTEITQDGKTRFLSCTCHKDSYFSYNQLSEDVKLQLIGMLGEEGYQGMERGMQRKYQNETSFDTPRLIAAYTAARQARFEFGR